MKLWKKNNFVFLVLILIILEQQCLTKLQNEKNHKDKVNKKTENTNDPFKLLGVEDLDPKKLLNEIEAENKSKGEEVNQLNTIEDLPGFLKTSKLSDEELMETLSRFLLQDDMTLKQYGAVYDKTGFDGIPGIKELPLMENERFSLRAQSAASLFVNNKLRIPSTKYIGIEQTNEQVENWVVFKAMFINERNENLLIKICLPVDESLVALCSDKDDPCYFKAQESEKIKKSNEGYLNNIHSHYFVNRINNAKKKKILKGNELPNAMINSFQNNPYQNIGLQGYSNQIQMLPQGNFQNIPLNNNSFLANPQLNMGNNLLPNLNNYNPLNNFNNANQLNPQNTQNGFVPSTDSLNNQQKTENDNKLESNKQQISGPNEQLTYKFKQTPLLGGGGGANGYGDISENMTAFKMPAGAGAGYAQGPQQPALGYGQQSYMAAGASGGGDLNSMSKEQLIGLVNQLRGGGGQASYYQPPAATPNYLGQQGGYESGMGGGAGGYYNQISQPSYYQQQAQQPQGQQISFKAGFASNNPNQVYASAANGYGGGMNFKLIKDDSYLQKDLSTSNQNKSGSMRFKEQNSNLFSVNRGKSKIMKSKNSQFRTNQSREGYNPIGVGNYYGASMSYGGPFSKAAGGNISNDSNGLSNISGTGGRVNSAHIGGFGGFKGGHMGTNQFLN